MATVAPELTEEAVEAVLELVRQRPGITATELAAEFKRLGVDPQSLLFLREVLDAAIVAERDTGPAEPSESEEDPADAELWGPPPSAAEVLEANGTANQLRRAALATALKGSMTREQAAEWLGVTAQAISARLKAGRLTALQRGREWRFPAWQFSDSGTVPGLSEVLAAWPGTELALSTWAVKPHADLDGRSPVRELMRRGGTERVLALVEAISASAW